MAHDDDMGVSFFRSSIFEKKKNISRMRVIYEKMMMEKDVRNFILDMGKIEISAISQKFLRYGRNFCHFE